MRAVDCRLELALLLILFAGARTSTGLDLAKCTNRALGMESGEILDEQLTASSSFDVLSVGPQNGRIRTEQQSGAWCPKQQIRNSSYEFLQVNFDKNLVVRAVETQGRYGNGTGREYAQHYFVDYWRMGAQWIRYRNRTGHQLMDGNENTADAVYRTLDPPVIASRIRVVPFSSTTRTTCLRMELYGCEYEDGLVAYSIARNSSLVSSDLSSKDAMFEATELEDVFGSKKGLGLLTDGYIAKDNSHSALNSSWIGFDHNSTDGKVQVLFEFDELRNFSAVEMFHFGASPTQVTLEFFDNSSLLSKQLVANDQRISQLFDPSLSLRATTNTLKMAMQGKSAKYLRLSITFDSPWLYLTEIRFIQGNESTIESTTASNIPANESSSQMQLLGSYFAVFLLLTLFVSMVGYFCMLYIVKRSRSSNKLGTSSARNSFYSKPGVLITTLGGDGVPKHILQNTNAFLSSSYSQDFSAQLNSSIYASAHQLGGPKQRILGHGTQSSFSFSTNLNRGGEKPSIESTPSLSNFNFPPPPPSSSTTSDDIYAEPCANAPLLPPKLRTSASANLVAHNAKSMYRKPVPKPRSFREFRHRTLPSRATKNLTSKVHRSVEDESSSSPSQIIEERIAPNPPNTCILRSSMEILDRIAEGKFTQICKCSFLNNSRHYKGNGRTTQFVIKTPKPGNADDPAARQALVAEAEVMRLLGSHPSFMEFIGQCEDYSIVTEYAPLRDVRTAIRAEPSKFSYTVLLNLCSSLAVGMKYLESRGIIHGHLSPRSCLLGERMNSIRIASPRGPNLHAQLRYSAPEAIVRDNWSTKTDVWSFAVTCWEILNLCSCLPYNSLSNAQIVENCQKVLAGSPEAIYLEFSKDHICREIVELLGECWSADQSLRPSFLEIHLFFTRKTMNPDVRC